MSSCGATPTAEIASKLETAEKEGRFCGDIQNSVDYAPYIADGGSSNNLLF